MSRRSRDSRDSAKCDRLVEQSVMALKARPANLSGNLVEIVKVAISFLQWAALRTVSCRTGLSHVFRCRSPALESGVWLIIVKYIATRPRFHGQPGCVSVNLNQLGVNLSLALRELVPETVSIRALTATLRPEGAPRRGSAVDVSASRGGPPDRLGRLPPLSFTARPRGSRRERVGAGRLVAAQPPGLRRFSARSLLNVAATA